MTLFVDEPERITAPQMDQWRRDFDNWGSVSAERWVGKGSLKELQKLRRRSIIFRYSAI